MKTPFSNSNYPNTKKSAFEFPKFMNAKVPDQFDNIKIVVGSEELVFNETYVTGVLTNNHIARFKKNTLVFTA